MQNIIDLVSPFWLALGAGLVVFGVLLFWLLYRRRKHRAGLKYALGSVALDRVEDVFVPDGMGGEIHVEQLVLTARGILVINVKHVEGVVFASDRMNEWAVMGPKGRTAFPNPQGDLYDRVAAVRQLVRDVDVSGYVLFPAGADFSKGRPKDVVQPAELLSEFPKPPRAEAKRVTERFAVHWGKIRSVVKPARTRPPRLN